MTTPPRTLMKANSKIKSGTSRVRLYHVIGQAAGCLGWVASL